MRIIDEYTCKKSIHLVMPKGKLTVDSATVMHFNRLGLIMAELECN